MDKKELARQKRHRRVRKRIFGTPDCPRLNVHRSLKNIYLGLIDDSSSRTIVFMSTLSPAFREKLKYGGNIKAAGLAGELLAKEALARGITTIVFDRGGYLYHGRVKAAAEAARKSGLKF